MSQNYRSNRLRRNSLYKKQDGKCHWCKKNCIKGPFPRGVKIPEDAATLDHLVDRNEQKHSKCRERKKACVMACHRCNHDRGIKSHQQMLDRKAMRRGFKPLTESNVILYNKCG